MTAVSPRTRFEGVSVSELASEASSTKGLSSSAAAALTSSSVGAAAEISSTTSYTLATFMLRQEPISSQLGRA